MSEQTKAVFLSYASEDAEAAKRVCEALRSAGVEVWFDQNELVGGDAWDQKIRGQIASCALFVPLISANTQARLEGYFRLEWKLAAQRTHTMADEKVFLLPVVIDDTRDPEAKVPAEFKSVQWTRLHPMGAESGDPAVAKFAMRAQKLLAGGTVSPVAGGVAPGPSSPAMAAGSTPLPTGLARARWLPVAIGLGVLVAGAVVWTLRPAPSVPSVAAAKPASPVADDPVARVWELLNRPEMARAELDLAEGICRQAADNGSANLLAAWSSVHTWIAFHGYDRSPERIEAARSTAAKAMRLAPHSYEARLAQALFWVRCDFSPPRLAEAQKILRELLREKPDEPRALFNLGFALANDPQTLDEGLGYLERLGRNPDFAAVALNEAGWLNYFIGRFDRAQDAADRSVKARPYWNNLGLQITLALYVHGDTDRAQRLLGEMPASVMQEDWGVSYAWRTYLWSGQPQRALDAVESVQRDWVRNFFDDTPRAYLQAEARQAAGQQVAARRDYQRALDQFNTTLARDPNNGLCLVLKAVTLRELGRDAEARETYRLLLEIKDSLRANFPVLAQIQFEPPAEAIALVRAIVQSPYKLEMNNTVRVEFTASALRLNPWFARLRAEPEFAQVIAEAAAREAASVAASSPPAVLSTPELAEIGRLLGDRTSIGINRAELTTEKIRLLDVLARKAITATPDNAEAWAVAAEIDYLQYLTGRDRSRERQAQMNQRMLRAVELDAQSFDVRWIKMAVLSRTAQTPAAWQDLENQLLALQRERPDHEGTLAAVASGKTWSGQTHEGAAMLMKLRLHDEAFWAYMRAGDWAHAEEAARKRMEMPDCLHEGLFFLGFVLVNGREDPDAALAALEQLPLAARVEDRFAQMLWWLHMLRRDPDNAMVALAGLPQEWVGSAPVAHFRASAHHLAGRNEASQIEWRQALAQVEQRLSATPNNTDLLRIKALILADLGQTAEALRVSESERQLSARPVDDLSRSWSVQLLAGNKEPVLRWLERELPKRNDLYLRSMVRYSEHYDTLRGDPRFEKLIRDTLPPGSKPFDETKPLGRQ